MESLYPNSQYLIWIQPSSPSSPGVAFWKTHHKLAVPTSICSTFALTPKSRVLVWMLWLKSDHLAPRHSWAHSRTCLGTALRPSSWSRSSGKPWALPAGPFPVDSPTRWPRCGQTPRGTSQVTSCLSHCLRHWLSARGAPGKGRTCSQRTLNLVV